MEIQFNCFYIFFCIYFLPRQLPRLPQRKLRPCFKINNLSFSVQSSLRKKCKTFCGLWLQIFNTSFSNIVGSLFYCRWKRRYLAIYWQTNATVPPPLKKQFPQCLPPVQMFTIILLYVCVIYNSQTTHFALKWQNITTPPPSPKNP